MVPTNNTNYFGEIIESSITHFVFQTWDWKVQSPFGSIIMVKNKDETVYGIVYQIKTGSQEGDRQVHAYQKPLEELEIEHPHIFSFLKTTVYALPLGYKKNNTIIGSLPTKPCLIHAFVGQASLDELKTLLTSNYSYLNHLFALQADLFSIDELLLSLLSFQESIDPLFKKNRETFLSAYSLLIGNDYNRLRFFIEKIGQIEHVKEVKN
jgi:hypothetical protein